MKTQMKDLLIFTVVLSMSAYFSACASSKAQKKVEEEPSAMTETGAGSHERQPRSKAHAKAEQQNAVAKEQQKAAGSEEQTKTAEANMAAESAAVVGELEMIHFDFDKSDIKPEYRDILAKNAEILKSHPSLNVVVEGHCDEIGTQEYNIALGERRANSTKKYLESLGVKGSELSTISYGMEKPLDPAHTKEAHAKNRRAQFTVK